MPWNKKFSKKNLNFELEVLKLKTSVDNKLKDLEIHNGMDSNGQRKVKEHGELRNLIMDLTLGDKPAK